MKKYFLIFKFAILDALEYRVDLFIHVIKYALFTSLTALIWISVSEYSTFSPMSADQLIIYYLIASITYSFSNYHTAYIENDIRTGHVSLFFVKPISPFFYYFSFQMGINLLEAVLRTIILGLLAYLFLPALNFSSINIIYFMLSLLIVYIFTFTSYFCFSLLAFWLQYVDSIRMSYLFISRLFSGILVPVTFFSVSLQEKLRFLPFPYLTHAPIEIIQGKSNIYSLIAVLFSWILIVILVYKLLWNKALKSYESIGI